MKRKGVVIISKLLAMAAVIFVSTACWWAVYRPEVPSELKKPA
ncbi:cyclic lactone autoinducer peptide [Cohnella cholangitidis]|uniref:Cyclic lactone autoinducer peptide n=1 Tax=Cohnella cholangitidis TaxID=2598458 RepID=A0A7G5C2U4_9BACL|nr:cyclic lactone autoinducer peptide [Cohnella cholangitidis]QMV43528.1 cyclic lactone autoinducer peptide [Cohnella cholangitidis]